MACAGAVLILLAAPAWADDGVQVGAVYRGVMQLKTYGSPQVPLPPGDWKLVVLGEGRTNPENIRFVRGYLLQTKGDVLAGRVYFMVPDAPWRAGWSMPGECASKIRLANYTTSSSFNFGAFDCAYLKTFSMVRGANATAELTRLYEYMDSAKLKKPLTILYAGFAVSDGRTYLFADYSFNPDLETIKPAASVLWHEDRYKEDSKREAYVEKLKLWVQDWRPKVMAGFNSRLSVQASAR